MEVGRIHNTYTEGYQKKDAIKETGNTDSVEDYINAGDLHLTGQQDSRLKSLFAQKVAWETQLEQFKKDTELDESIKKHAENSEAYLKEADLNQNEVGRLKQLKDDLKKAYGIEEDSIEQSDLELWEKKVEGSETLSQEELDRMDQMGPLTDYQEASLEYTFMSKVFQQRADQSVEASIIGNKTISAIKLGRLKTHPMIDAKKEAEAFLEQINEEIRIEITEEIKNKVNENLDIKPEEQLLTKPQALINQKKITEEDIKGLTVDETV